MKRIIAGFLCAVFVAGMLMGCGKTAASETAVTGDVAEEQDKSVSDGEHVTTTEGIQVDLQGDYSDFALDSSWDKDEAVKIELNGTSITTSGEGVAVKDGAATISKKGTYVVSGTLTDGQLIVDLTEDENVQLVLNGAEITCTTGAPLVILNAKNTCLTLAEGSQNTLHDNSEYVETEEENINAAVYSKDDLMINGTGSLTVEAGRNDGITSKDDLQIIEGTITVHAADDGIVGKDSVSIRDGSLTVTAGGDTIKSSRTDALDQGYVVVDGGTLRLQAGDDGIHSETALVINQGNITITDSVEGLESLNVVINEGTVDIKSSDDGINVAGGPDSQSADTAAGGELGGKGFMDEAIDGALVIHGGTVTVNAAGDGLDSNGGILVTGGTTCVYGPVDNGNGALDFAGSMEMTGGVLFASGSSGMVQAPSEISAQESIAAKFDTAIPENTKVKIVDAKGTELFSTVSPKNFECVVFSMPEIKTGESYTIMAGENSVVAAGGELSGFAGMGGHGNPGAGRGPGGVSENGMRRGPGDGSVSGNDRMPPQMEGSLSENGRMQKPDERMQDGANPPEKPEKRNQL